MTKVLDRFGIAIIVMAAILALIVWPATPSRPKPVMWLLRMVAVTALIITASTTQQMAARLELWLTIGTRDGRLQRSVRMLVHPLAMMLMVAILASVRYETEPSVPATIQTNQHTMVFSL
jgi:hypothetical protein